MFEETRSATRAKVSTLQIVMPDTKVPIFTLNIYDDGSVSGVAETMRAEHVGPATQIIGALMAQAQTAQMVLQSKKPFDKDDVKKMLLVFLRALFKEIANSAKVDWSEVEAEEG